MKLSLQQKIQSGFAVALAFLLLVGISAWWTSEKNAEAFRRVEHTRSMISALDEILVELLNMETGSRGFAISGNEKFLESYYEGLATIEEKLQKVGTIVGDDPGHHEVLLPLAGLIDSKIGVMDESIVLRRTGGEAPALAYIASGIGKKRMDEIRAIIAGMRREEGLRLTESMDAARTLSGLFMVLITFGGVLAFGSVAMARRMVCRDFERRRKAEEERDRFFNESIDLLGVANSAGYFTRVNPAFTRTLGWSTEEIMAKPYLEFVVPDDREATRSEQAKLSSGEKTLHFENRYLCRDGSTRILAWHSAPQPDGTIFATARDVTEVRRAGEALRRSEESLAVTLRSIGDGVLATDRQGRVTRLNPVAEKLTGWPGAEAIGRPVGDVFRVISGTNRIPVEVPIARVLASREAIAMENHTTIVARDGTECPIADSAAPIRQEDGTVLGVVLVFRDITEEQKAAKAVLDSNVLNRAVLNSMMANIAVVDRAGKVLAVNESWERVGVEGGPAAMFAGSKIGANYLEFCERMAPGMDWRDARRGIRSVLSDAQAMFKYEYPSVTASGLEWFTMNVSHLQRPEGGAVIAQINVTERRRAEEEIKRLLGSVQEEKERLSCVLNSITDEVWFANLDRKFTLANPAALREFHLEELHDMDVERVEKSVEILRSDLSARPIEESPPLRALAGEVIIGEEEVIRRPGTGELRHRQVNATPVHDARGQTLGSISVVRDITDRKRAEDEIRQFNVRLEELVIQRTSEVQQAFATLDAAADGAYMFDPETLIFSYVNKGGLQQLGYTWEEVIAMRPVDIDTGNDEAAYREMLAPMVRGEQHLLAFESCYRRKDGTEFPVDINLQFVTPEGAPGRFVAIVRDITERKRIEAHARRSHRLESIGSLASGVAHDLNNALAPIMMGTEILRRQYPGESRIVDMFEASAKRSSDMVRQLVSFAKGAKGERVVLRPTDLITEIAKLMEGSFPKNIEIIVNCPRDLPTMVGDPTQLHQVLLNLCVNARDAMPGGGKLTLDASSRKIDASYASAIPNARAGAYLVLSVEDSGSGISAEIQDRIFDPFFTTKGPEKGTGLGLSTVIGIVKGHGGFVHLYSQAGHGAKFTVYLPAEHAEADVSQPKSDGAEFRGNGETVLVVDDEAPVREVASLVLERLNLVPVTASDGADGLVKVAKYGEALSAVITDLHMPHMDGLAFVRALRRIAPGLPVIVASGRMEESLIGEFQSLGVKLRLDKPFNEHQLADILKTALAGYTGAAAQARSAQPATTDEENPAGR